ncbi:hypothetical protein Tco_1246399 [Tanacetum coccineum]
MPMGEAWHGGGEGVGIWERRGRVWGAEAAGMEKVRGDTAGDGGGAVSGWVWVGGRVAVGLPGFPVRLG